MKNKNKNKNKNNNNNINNNNTMKLASQWCGLKLSFFPLFSSSV